MSHNHADSTCHRRPLSTGSGCFVGKEVLCGALRHVVPVGRSVRRMWLAVLIDNGVVPVGAGDSGHHSSDRAGVDQAADGAGFVD